MSDRPVALEMAPEGYNGWHDAEFVQGALAQIESSLKVQRPVAQIPRQHNLTLLCKSKNKVVAEYALSDKTQPLGIAEYKLLESMPEPLQASLPSIEQIERELKGSEEI